MPVHTTNLKGEVQEFAKLPVMLAMVMKKKLSADMIGVLIANGERESRKRWQQWHDSRRNKYAPKHRR